MKDVRVRTFWAVLAYLGFNVFAQLVLSLTPYELDDSITTEGRAIGLAVDIVWALALVVLMIRQPSSELWKILLFFEFAATIWVLGYLPIDARPLIEIPLFVFGDLWAAVFVHLILAYPSGRLRDTFDRRYLAFIYAFAIGIKVVGLVLGPDECWPVCDNPIRWFPSETLWTLISNVAGLLVAVFLGIALFELWRHWRDVRTRRSPGDLADGAGGSDLGCQRLRGLLRRRLPRPRGAGRDALLEHHRARPGPDHPGRDPRGRAADPAGAWQRRGGRGRARTGGPDRGLARRPRPGAARSDAGAGLPGSDRRRPSRPGRPSGRRSGGRRASRHAHRPRRRDAGGAHPRPGRPRRGPGPRRGGRLGRAAGARERTALGAGPCPARGGPGVARADHRGRRCRAAAGRAGPP